MAKINGYTLYTGPSSFDGSPIALIITGIANKSTNSKTGAMLQTYILRTDIDPVAAIKSGADISICGDCKHRPKLAAVNGEARCYVNVGQGAAAVYKSYKAGNYPVLPLDRINEIVKGRRVRFGTYGDPCVCPVEIFQEISKHCDRFTGYTHRWQDPNFSPAWFPLVMASVDNVSEMFTAKALGMRYFRVQIGSRPPEQWEISCPASAEAGKLTTCERCCLCSGTSTGAKNIVIRDHGLGHKSRAKLADYFPTLPIIEKIFSPA